MTGPWGVAYYLPLRRKCMVRFALAVMDVATPLTTTRVA